MQTSLYSMALEYLLVLVVQYSSSSGENVEVEKLLQRDGGECVCQSLFSAALLEWR